MGGNGPHLNVFQRHLNVLVDFELVDRIVVKLCGRVHSGLTATLNFSFLYFKICVTKFEEEEKEMIYSTKKHR